MTTVRERFRAALNGEKADRLPVVEWSGIWWDKTIAEWVEQGLPPGMNSRETYAYFGLDRHDGYWLSPRGDDCPRPSHHGAGIIKDENDYERLHDKIFCRDKIKIALEKIKDDKPNHESGITPYSLTVDGYFWFPRSLLGIEGHLTAFYDRPELMRRINRDQTDFSLEFINEALKIIKPEFMSVAEDMSYNHGPMISKEFYDIFMKPYYLQIIPVMKEYGAKVLIDTDGFCEPMIPWYIEAGVDGVLPLERMSGVDINRIRREFPEFIMMQGYDKTALMDKGEDAIRDEFERIFPVMKSGWFLPSVDHQTPPGVPLKVYKRYVEMFFDYAFKAMN